MCNLTTDSFPDLHYPSMMRETLEIIHVINTLVHFLVFPVAYTSFDIDKLQIPEREAELPGGDIPEGHNIVDYLLLDLHRDP